MAKSKDVREDRKGKTGEKAAVHPEGARPRPKSPKIATEKLPKPAKHARTAKHAAVHPEGARPEPKSPKMPSEKPPKAEKPKKEK